MQLLAKFKKILYMGFRATLNFRKFKVALNPIYRIFLNFAKSCILCRLSKFKAVSSFGACSMLLYYPFCCKLSFIDVSIKTYLGYVATWALLTNVPMPIFTLHARVILLMYVYLEKWCKPFLQVEKLYKSKEG